MQISRLFKITYLLIERETITAAELAERFEVSTRTIYRDLDKLAESGIPLYTNRGKGGGISLMEGFVLDKSVLSEKEQKDILSGLQNLKALNLPGEEGNGVNEALSKLSALFQKDQKDWIDVDFSSWNSKEGDPDHFSIIKTAIFDSKTISFTYSSSKGIDSHRVVEPYRLQFKSSNWYLYAYCLTRKDFRIFKLSRMRDMIISQEDFMARVLPQQESSQKVHPRAPVSLVLKIDSSQAYRVYDEFPREGILENGPDSFTVRITFPEDEWVYGYIMSFGDKAQVISPNRVRRLIKKRYASGLKKYL